MKYKNTFFVVKREDVPYFLRWIRKVNTNFDTLNVGNIRYAWPIFWFRIGENDYGYDRPENYEKFMADYNHYKMVNFSSRRDKLKKILNEN